MSEKKFILADKQDVTKAGIKTYILQAFPDAQIDEAPNVNALLAMLNNSQNVVVVLDYTLFDIDSIASLMNIKDRYALCRWVMFSNELTQEAIRIFASDDNISIVLKDNSQAEITSALQCAAAGDKFLCHQIVNLLQKERTQHKNEAHLTPTEIEILKLIARGKTAKEIANERNSSIHTIITHKKNIFSKIEVNNVYEATKYALHAGLIDMMEYYI